MPLCHRASRKRSLRWRLGPAAPWGLRGAGGGGKGAAAPRCPGNRRYPSRACDKGRQVSAWREHHAGLCRAVLVRSQLPGRLGGSAAICRATGSLGPFLRAGCAAAWTPGPWRFKCGGRTRTGNQGGGPGPPGEADFSLDVSAVLSAKCTGTRGGQNREAMQGGTGQRLPRRAASWLRGISLPCPPSPPPLTSHHAPLP